MPASCRNLFLQPQKALAIAMKGKAGWAQKLAADISDVFGGEKLNPNTTQTWKKTFDAAMKTTGVARQALLRAFVSRNAVAECFKCEQRSLGALAVFYAVKYKEDQRDSATRAQIICKEVGELFSDEILQPAAVQVSNLGNCRHLATSMHCSSQSTILQRRKKRLKSTVTTRSRRPTQTPRASRLRLHESESERKNYHRFLLLPHFLT